MVGFSLVAPGNFNRTIKHLEDLASGKAFSSLDGYGRAGVAALSGATPTETGTTAAAWSYEITRTKNGFSINWVNNHVNDGVNIAIILQYGHGTGTGGYIQGRDYINPAMRPIFDQILADIERQVRSG